MVAWVDDDAFVQQLGVHPAEWLEGGDVAIGNQTSGVLNTGVMVLRNSPWTRRLVRAWLTDPACEGFKRSPRSGGGVAGCGVVWRGVWAAGEAGWRSAIGNRATWKSPISIGGWVSRSGRWAEAASAAATSALPHPLLQGAFALRLVLDGWIGALVGWSSGLAWYLAVSRDVALPARACGWDRECSATGNFAASLSSYSRYFVHSRFRVHSVVVIRSCAKAVRCRGCAGLRCCWDPGWQGWPSRAESETVCDSAPRAFRDPTLRESQPR